MTPIVWTYFTYLLISVSLTVWVAKTLHKNGRIFLVDTFRGNEPLADSINHLLRFADWCKVFRRVALHLKDDGVFIFDINTVGKLQRLVKGPAWERWIGHDLAIIKVTGGRQGLFEWDVKIFERQNRNSYRLFHEKISEIVFPKQRIVSSLRSHFKEVKTLDPFGAKASDQSERLYFVCRVRHA